MIRTVLLMILPFSVAAAGLLIPTPSNAAIQFDMVTVGNAGNAADDTGYGAVGYNYNIGKYEVTAGQYTSFLNAVADTDPYGLYNSSMFSHPYGCKIERTGSLGSYNYSVAPDRSNRPVNFVDWGDAVRFANWLHNDQGSGDTEDGSYDLSGTHPYYDPDGSINDGGGLSTALMAVNRESVATWAIPTEDEWYKAAYHKNDGDTGNYFDYATNTDNLPGNDILDPDTGNNATYYQNGYTLYIALYQMTEVGEFENSESPYGTFDQTGNALEWTGGVYGEDRLCLRGGNWTAHSDQMSSSFRNYAYASSQNSSVFGFRLVTVEPVPAPSSLTCLIGVGVLVGLNEWRKKRRLERRAKATA